jgi:parvulin-like peptidyl-prolyl isomerase
VRSIERAAWNTGAAIGIVLAVAGTLNPASPFTGRLPSDAIARVNGKAIPATALAHALARLSNDGAPEMTAEERALVLDRLIDEELLVQRGVEIGLVDSDRMVRRAITMAAIDSIVEEAPGAKPSESELREFHESQHAVFAAPAMAHVQEIFFGSGKDREAALGRAREAAAEIAKGMSFEVAKTRYGDADGVPVPDAPLPFHVLHRHLGPSLASRVLDMTPGEASPPVESPSGYHLLHLVSMKPESVRPFEDVRSEVENEYVRRARDEALSKVIRRLRGEASIVLSPAAPRSTGER